MKSTFALVYVQKKKKEKWKNEKNFLLFFVL